MDYRLDLLDPDLPADDPRVAGHLNAIAQGFHGKRMSESARAREWRYRQADRMRMIAVYAEGPVGALGDDVPVATYESAVKDVNAGRGLVPCSLVTCVTVRPTHRRRGLLRQMIENDLRATAEAGVPLSALTASEATIYGRFGFGAATFVHRVELSTRRDHWGLRHQPGGQVELAEPAELAELSSAVFGQFHADTLGSVGRLAFWSDLSTGWDHEADEQSKTMRAAVHYDADGQADGYVLYKPEADSDPATLKVHELTTATPDAALALWDFLGHVDLIERVQFNIQRVNDPLPWAMTNARAYKVTSGGDFIWVRVLDVAAALQARRFEADGQVALRVHDRLGIAEGTYRLEVADGEAHVERWDGEPDVELDVEALGSLYLGGVSVPTLARAGRLHARDVPAAARLLDLAEQPYCPTFF